MKISTGPTGNLIQGHVFDVNRKSLEESVKAYDRQLYFKWNPYKRGGSARFGRAGLGCWELRRKPDKLTMCLWGEHEGTKYYSLEPVENDLISHVMDVPFLSYSILDKLKEMDKWADNTWLRELEYNEDKSYTKRTHSYLNELKYHLKHDKKLYRDWKEMILSGDNPNRIAKYWK